jgi:hypothetical protein
MCVGEEIFIYNREKRSKNIINKISTKRRDGEKRKKK